ncbi:hypothetical protein KFK09_011230 [Dendrobium nobile]|uniref:Uncharacterized protein n=1 Tax=Dendrobium nobile TaxID=94219 RepID=A0A8T3BC38_DENNO|nr:hypothetical protein KFK09_011230 [Dendrobium nobile]
MEGCNQLKFKIFPILGSNEVSVFFLSSPYIAIFFSFSSNPCNKERVFCLSPYKYVDMFGFYNFVVEVSIWNWNFI